MNARNLPPLLSDRRNGYVFPKEPLPVSKRY